MYTKMIPYKDFLGKPRNEQVAFNLEVREVFKNIQHLGAIFSWRDSIDTPETRDLSTEEVVEFYNHFEEILLAAWGELSEDGRYFRKAGRYDFEDTKLFAAVMEMFLADLPELNKFLNNILPQGMDEIVKKQQASLEALEKDPQTSADLAAEVAQLRAQLLEKEGRGPDAPVSDQ